MVVVLPLNMPQAAVAEGDGSRLVRQVYAPALAEVLPECYTFITRGAAVLR